MAKNVIQHVHCTQPSAMFKNGENNAYSQFCTKKDQKCFRVFNTFLAIIGIFQVPIDHMKTTLLYVNIQVGKIGLKEN